MVRYPPEDTSKKHDTIIGEAGCLFRDRGFANVTIRDIMQSAGLTHGSFYGHFPDKQTLLAECLAAIGTRVKARLQTLKPTSAGKRKYIADYLTPQHRDDPAHGCPMTALAGDIAREPAIKPAMTNYIQSVIGKLASHFPWSGRATPRGQALCLTASMVGALLLSRAVDDEKLSDEILREVSADLIRRYGAQALPKTNA